MIAAHGGGRYDSASTVRTRLHVDGLALALKWQRGMLDDYTATVSTQRPQVTLEPFGDAGHRGVLDGHSVRIETNSGEPIAQRANPRAEFKRLRRQLRWDDLDLCYFASYAIWGYINAPFMFTRPGFETREIEPWAENGEAWRGLEVVFPDDVPAHSKVQRYYFDERDMLRRNDYTAEVFGNWAKAAHYCYDHKQMAGVTLPTRRRAMPRARDGKPRKQIGLVNIRVKGLELE